MKLTALMIGTLALAASSLPAEPLTPAQRAFEAIKKLKGAWQEGEGEKSFRVVYKVTGGGATVIETQFPDTAMEMVTVYHMDGPNTLLLTHYCAAMNQPKMRYVKGPSDRDFRFEFVGGTNMKKNDMHIHNVRYRILSADHIMTDWEGYAEGKPAGTETFDLHRVK